MNLAELLEIPAEIFPEQEIIRFEEESISYAQLQERVARAAAVLRGLGVQPGDRVAVMETNTPDVVETLFAAASIGAVFVPLNFRARPDETFRGLVSMPAERLKRGIQDGVHRTKQLVKSIIGRD